MNYGLWKNRREEGDDADFWGVARSGGVGRTGHFSKMVPQRRTSRINIQKFSEYTSSYQHGFMQKKITVTNLACFCRYISEVIDDKSEVDVIYTDFRKTFDQIGFLLLIYSNLIENSLLPTKITFLGHKILHLGYHKAPVLDRCCFAIHK